MSLKLLRYETEDKPFAFGGMGEIYSSTDRLSGNKVAIKTINAQRLRIDDKTVETFMKEAEASFRLSAQSPHIVSVLDIGFEDSTHYMAQEFIEGGDIENKLGDCTGTEAKTIIQHILNGVKTAHTNKIVHSDISPDNVLYCPKTKHYKLSDFGILKILETHLITKGQTIHQGGKPHYMPPAHYFNPDLINEQTDFYAIGIVYHFLLSGTVLKPNFPNPPSVAANAVTIKKTNAKLHAHGINFINNCVQSKYKTADQLIAAINLVPNQ